MLSQLSGMLAGVLAAAPNPVRTVLMFFLYSLIGYVLECVVLSVDHRQLVVNRGFVRHLPFCIIYGFGCLTGYAVLQPIADNWLLLALVGSVLATSFEFLVAKLQIRLFGDFWWDYSEKPFNYKGIVCLESTIGWALAAILVLKVLHRPLEGLVSHIPAELAAPLAVVLVAGYLADFVYSVRAAGRERGKQETEELYTEK